LWRRSPKSTSFASAPSATWETATFHPTFQTDERNAQEMHRVEEAFKEIFEEAIGGAAPSPASMALGFQKNGSCPASIAATRRCA
jgi:hypothetical protein